MTQRMPWYRMYDEVISDRKIDLVCRMTGQRRFAVFGVWTVVLSLANQATERGQLVNSDRALDTIDIAFQADMEQADCDAIIEAFMDERVMMLTMDEGVIIVCHWAERQPKGDSTGAARAKKYRDKNKACPAVESEASDDPGDQGDIENGHYPKDHVTVTLPSRDSHGLDKIREDKSLTTTTTPRENDKNLSLMMNLYENNIAVTVSPILADELKDYSARIKDPEWIRHAFKQAAAANVRKWSYVKAILDSCITAGRITEKPKRNGAKQNGSYSNKTRPKQTAVRATGKGENVADLLGVSEPDDRKSINRLSGGIVGTTS